MTEFFRHLIEEFNLPLHNPVLIFSLILFIILLSPILLRKLNVPSIIGLILSGVIIGPYAFNILEDSSAIRLFSTIGLLYIMFIAGLELDLSEFKTNRNRSLLFGFFTFIFPLSIGFPVCYFILNYGFAASLLTASMFATHTLVAYPIVSKLGVTKNQAVAITVGGTVLTDTAVLILLTVIVGGNKDQIDANFWLTFLVSLAAFAAIMFFIIPRVAKWFFRKLESEKHLHYVFVLSVVFFAAFLAEVAGVEKIIGAFVAGLVLNPLIPHSSALMNRIEFIGNALFIPFFLISVGMLVDLSVVMNGPTALIVAVTLTIVALFGKWMAALVSQIVFKYSKAQRRLIFGLSSSHAAATLAVILVGYKENILDENILNGTIILILITCIVASFATEKAARTIVMSGTERDSQPQELDNLNNEHILLAYSESGKLSKQLEFATLIKENKSPNPITLLSVVPNNEEVEENIRFTRNKLQEFVLQAAANEVKINVVTTIDHNTASGIARISREMITDIVMIDWPEKKGVFEKIMGEKIDSVVNNVEKNLFICRFNHSVVHQKRVVLITPELMELERGFKTSILKVARIAKEVSMPIYHVGSEKTHQAIRQILHANHLNIKLQFKLFTEWDDFLVMTREFNKYDLVVFFGSRKASVSYVASTEKIPLKLDKYFDDNNLIVVYPQRHGNAVSTETFEGIPVIPAQFSKGIEAIEQIGKGIGNMFKKDSEE